METAVEGKVQVQLMANTLEEIEQAARSWNEERIRQAKAREQAERENERLEMAKVCDGVAELLPVALRPLIQFGYWKYANSPEASACIILAGAQWQVGVMVRRYFNPSKDEWLPWRLDSRDFPFRPLMPKLTVDEDNHHYVTWTLGDCGSTDNLLEAISGAMELGKAFEILQQQADSRNAQPQEAPVKEPVYEHVKENGEPEFKVMDWFVTLVRDVVREELVNRAAA